MQRNKPVLKQWVTMLRSGEFTQVKNRLRRDGGHCCLGVLCELSAVEHGGFWEVRGALRTEDVFVADYRGAYDVADGGMLPAPVVEWAGITETGQSQLSSLNDAGYSFAQIADFIEQVLNVPDNLYFADTWTREVNKFKMTNLPGAY